MRHTTPKAWLISRPAIDFNNLREYLKTVGGTEWLDRVLEEHPLDPDDPLVDGEGEILVEAAGRMCYRSWKPGLNPNVTKVRQNSHEYLQNILASWHGSVVEHAQYSFILQDVSRIFTQELERHRVGIAISQESLRYVRLEEIPMEMPTIFEQRPMVATKAAQLVEAMEDFQVFAAKEFGLDDPGVSFHYKKEVTSAMRRLAPEGLATTLVWSCNIRALRHVIETRTATGAEDEIRRVFDQVAHIMVPELPSLLGDFTRHTDGAWVPEHRKV